jgi:integrase
VSARDEAYNLRAYAFRVLGSKRLEDVKPADVKKVLSDALAAGRAHETLKKIRSAMSRVYQSAISDELVDDNPVAKTPLPKRRGVLVVKKKRTILTDEEIATYLACTKVDEELQLMSLVAGVEGGMRTGDLNRWDWTHIETSDFSRCVVPRSKTGDSQILEVPEVLRVRLRARWEAAGKPASGPVFPARRGKNQGGFRAKRGISYAERLRCDLEKAGLARRELFHDTATSLRVDFHSFRRAFNTALAAAGVNVQLAMKLAGHADERTHMRYVMDAPEMRRIPDAAIPKLPTSKAPTVPAQNSPEDRRPNPPKPTPRALADGRAHDRPRRRPSLPSLGRTTRSRLRGRDPLPDRPPFFVPDSATERGRYQTPKVSKPLRATEDSNL